MMQDFFADFHIHVGMNESGKWIKIPTSKHLTLRNILDSALTTKGMDLIGIVDALSPLVLQDMERLIEEGFCVLDSNGGYCYMNKLTIILGAEIETVEATGGMAHTLIYLPDIALMQKFSAHMSQYIRNINLSSQNAHISLSQLIEIAAAFEGIIIPAHVFTPYKGVYGACTSSLCNILTDKQFANIAAVELGLSADADMADRIKELQHMSFLSNSDAHSLDKIAREYNLCTLQTKNFAEFKRSLLRQEGRSIKANYGLNPRLGKYHRTLCQNCGYVESSTVGTWQQCPVCNSHKIVIGVFDRINEIATWSEPMHPTHRAPYFYQIPLEFLPGVGKKTLEKLLQHFGTEMNVLHYASEQELKDTVGSKLTENIIKARYGKLEITAGGGGIYGKVQK